MRIFISYARIDEPFARQLATALSQANADVWLDVDDIPAGMNWSSAIQQGLNQCDLMLAIISPEAMASPNVENEWQWYLDNHKPVIPILWRDAQRHFQLNRLQYINFKDQPFDNAFSQLTGEINRRTGGAILPVPSTQVASAKPFGLPVHDFRRYRWLLVIVIILAAFIILISFLPSLNLRPNPTPTRAALIPSVSPTTSQPTAKATLTIASTTTALPIAATLTPTPDPPPTNTTTLVPTSNPTVTDTATFTPTLSPMSTNSATWTSTSSPTLTNTATATVTSSPVLVSTSNILGFLGNPVLHNIDWKPAYQTFSGVEMALVPVGCFTMGSLLFDNEKPVTRQCFDRPFWIDHFEVTNKQFGSEGVFKGDEYPRDSVTWFQARDFCATRGAHLPTEREWEYAARGPDNLTYPWGNTFIADNVVYITSIMNKQVARQSAYIGSRPTGNSWVGASDMAGNVREWVSSIYQPYPYKLDDGREVVDGNTDNPRVLRGGAWSDYNTDNLSGSARNRANSKAQTLTNGFRCARDY
ncbi:MAG: SUMF1/EgtB/PvdO family nonheme iron enzyme [Anaerolineae bacterium]|nr:SUMF1/EgtB/PvdO family nonheme iron enzyme [Anaerolineae bacterium]